MSLVPHSGNLPEQQRPSAPAALVEWASAAQAAHQLAAPLCRTDFVPAHFKGNENAATAAILYGAEVGLSPLQALQGLFVIGGRPAMYARTMLAVTLGAGHEVRTLESTDVRAVVEAQRRGSSHVEKVVVTIDQAKRAGWTKNSKYSSEPATMLLARAQSQACRRIAPDALLGLSYSAEELLDEQDVQSEPKRTARRRTTVAEVVPPPEPDLTPEPVAAAPVRVQEVPEPDVEPDGPPLITRAQSAKLHATLKEQGHDRDSGLALIGGLIGRQIGSTNDLSKAEASTVIDALDDDAPAADEPPLWPEPAVVPE